MADIFNNVDNNALDRLADLSGFGDTALVPEISNAFAAVAPAQSHRGISLDLGL